ncbi:glutathione S-transferase [Fragilariopsis cylindrus CCMP1102]|uniref:Glutathione S-transferase n=1 Tax=Fragilariopsis cylindrus CCMP1102 TaxID=635003 RepID=A0A1E7FTT7_9STRA|nr:glutathione S-transferase [Fragilariopsis cylindrus CCMP1102]|eukprot:OEU21517.1 glutathione S-transferase [Fragilariopsis cylindrus CCMP1102]
MKLAMFSVTLLLIFAVNAQGFAVVPSTLSSSSLRKTKAAFVSSVRGGDTGTVDGLVLSSSSSSSSTTSEATIIDTSGIPSWESLESELEHFRSNVVEKEKPPLLTLYRDTNGWCPFCERVWVAIRAKGIPYQETTVSLQNKPEWYKQMVPSGLVPAVLFHGDDSNITSRNLVWESDAILYALDEMFPDTPRLMKKNKQDVDEEFDAAMDMQNRLQSAGFKFAYAGRNETSTEEEKQKVRNDFESALDELDTAFGEQRQKLKNPNSNDGCFRLGSEFSGIDAMMIPTLERWRYQLPLTENLDILENRIHLTKYFEHLDSFSPYSDRVAGDKYSWTATASQFLRYFGGGEDKPEVAAKIKRCDAAAKELEKEFINVNYQMNYVEDEDKDEEDDRLMEILIKAAADAKTSSNEKELSNESIIKNINKTKNDQISDERLFALEAVTKLISNHEAVVSDCVRDEPISQKHIPRGTDKDTADLLLRHVASVLLQTASLSLKPIIDNVADVVVQDSSNRRTQGAVALKTVATRLSVPRDMGAPAAALLREVLSIVAEDLLADEEVQTTVSTPTTVEKVLE